MTLLEEIQEAAASNEMDLATLLRKCQILAARLNVKPAEDWLEWELDGYPDEVPVPKYRVLHVELKGNFAGGYHYANDFTIPPGLVPKDIRQDVEHIKYRSSISSIEHLLEGANSGGRLTVPMGNLSLLLHHKVFPDMQCLAAWGVVGTAAMVEILNTVRNRVLKFSLELAKQAPEAGQPGQKATREVEVKATQIFNTIVHGSANFVQSAQNSTVVFKVSQGDFGSLKEALKEHGVSDNDLTELKQALDAEPNSSGQTFGTRVSDWIGKMTKKAADGTWQVGVGAAGNLLATAIGKYYGQ